MGIVLVVIGLVFILEFWCGLGSLLSIVLVIVGGIVWVVGMVLSKWLF